jgi:DNA-binding transcriptional regulator YdaS (Cro superfamily)
MTKLIQCAKGHNTRAALKANGINQGELANLLGVHPTSVSQWCFHGVSKKYATEVAELLSVPVGTITSKKRSSKLNAAPPQPAPRAESPKTEQIKAADGKTINMKRPEPRELLNINIITQLMDCRVTERQKAVLEQLMKQFIESDKAFRQFRNDSFRRHA